jgi:serine/threonine protein kinase
MGEVYRARDLRLGRDVAIKVLHADRVTDDDGRRRFVQEARAASSLNHPHIVTIHEITSSNGTDFIVMELVDGLTLDRLIPSHGFSASELLRIAIPIASALAAGPEERLRLRCHDHDSRRRPVGTSQARMDPLAGRPDADLGVGWVVAVALAKGARTFSDPTDVRAARRYGEFLARWDADRLCIGR